MRKYLMDCTTVPSYVPSTVDQPTGKSARATYRALLEASSLSDTFYVCACGAPMALYVMNRGSMCAECAAKDAMPAQEPTVSF